MEWPHRDGRVYSVLYTHMYMYMYIYIYDPFGQASSFKPCSFLGRCFEVQRFRVRCWGFDIVA